MKREIKLTKSCAKNPLRNRIAEVLVRCMEIRGETVYTIAEKTGISRRTIDRWTHGNGLTVDGLDVVFDTLGYKCSFSAIPYIDCETRIIERLIRKEETWGGV